ncbi:MAG: peroxide stress protein YaaA [Tissierellia bacterium]|nr:peroxide stress protein YaaA [Tissierellia bacterium]
MKIILSPAKNMNLNNPINRDWTLDSYTKPLVDQIKTMTDDDLKRVLKINDSVLSQVKDYLNDFDKPIVYQALDMYDGLSYRWFKKEKPQADDLKYLDERLVILSALYGPIKAFQEIKPYRLDFNSSLKVGTKSLKTYWKNRYTNFFNPDEIIINLASDEFSSLLDRKILKIIDLEFFQEAEKDGEKILKKHSTISKKARGAMLFFMAKNKVDTIDQLKDFNYDNYSYAKEKSKSDKLVFIKRA